MDNKGPKSNFSTCAVLWSIFMGSAFQLFYNFFLIKSSVIYYYIVSIFLYVSIRRRSIQNSSTPLRFISKKLLRVSI